MTTPRRRLIRPVQFPSDRPQKLQKLHAKLDVE